MKKAVVKGLEDWAIAEAIANELGLQKTIIAYWGRCNYIPKQKVNIAGKKLIIYNKPLAFEYYKKKLMVRKKTHTMQVRLGLAAYNELLYSEIGGGKNYYDKFLRLPSYPKLGSGVTIGVGYDLRFATLQSLRNDWGAYLTLNELLKITPALGLKGVEAESFCKINKKREAPFCIEYEVALKQFNEVELSKQVRLTIEAFPNSETLSPNAFGALVSIVFNRGNNLERPRMAEMKAIKDRGLIDKRDYGAISKLVYESKRWWDRDSSTPCKGVEDRRVREARLVLDHDDKYIVINI